MLKKIATFLLLAGLLWPVAAEAQIGTVPYTFALNENPISSTKVNTNFSTVYAAALNRTGGTMTGTLTTAAIMPDGDNTRDIGSAALSYNDGWFDGTLTIATATVTTGTITTLSSTSLTATQSAFGTGAAVSAGAIVNISGTFTGSGAGFGLSINPTITVPAGTLGALMSNVGTLVEAGSGTHTLLAAMRVMIPTITSGAATVTNTATVYIEGAPTATVTGTNYALWVDAGIAMFDAGVYERARTYAMGATQTRTFAAGNFTIDAGTWTVEEADVEVDTFRVVGDTLFWSLQLENTTIGTGTGIEYRVALPGGFTLAEDVRGFAVFGVGTGITSATVRGVSGQTYVFIQHLNTGAQAASTNDIDGAFQLHVKVS